MAERRPTPGTTRHLGAASAVALACLVSLATPAHASQQVAVPETVSDASNGAYEYLCDDFGDRVSAVDVLEAAGDHNTFLDLLRTYDPEGFEILADPALEFQTVWAPTDDSFAAFDDILSTLPDEEITAILGYHVSPTREDRDGGYSTVTPTSLALDGTVAHQTRTGILTGSDQRVRTTMRNGVLTVQGAHILATSWCTESGSVFAINTVIMEAPPLSVGERVIYAVFEYPLIALLGVAALGISLALLIVETRARRRHRRT